MRRLLAALVSLAFIGAGAPARDWRANAVESAEGWTFGKPGAPLLAEYGSLGCPHCGHFAAETGERIDGLVKAGKLRFAYRPFLIFPHDRAGNVLARCVPAPRRLAFLEAVYAAQTDTRGRLTAADADEATRGKLYNAELAGAQEHAQAIAEVSGLKALAASHGLAAAEADRCLATAPNYDWVANADLTARTAGISGTPTYIWLGKRLDGDLTPEALLKLLPN